MNVQDYIQSGAIEAWVLGLADEQEAAELLQLRSQHPEIEAAIVAFEESIQKQATNSAIIPAPQVKEKLFAQLKDEFIVPQQPTIPEKIVAEVPSAKVVAMQNTSGKIKYMAAASIALLIVSGALNVYLFNAYNGAKNDYLALLKENTTITADNKVYQTKMLDMYSSMQIMSSPDMVKVPMPGIAGKENNLTTVYWDQKTKDVYLLANKLPQAQTGKQYQLWALVDGQPVDAGLLEDCNGLCKLKNIAKAQAFAITLEEKGGSATPNLNELYVMGKVGG